MCIRYCTVGHNALHVDRAVSWRYSWLHANSSPRTPFTQCQQSCSLRTPLATPMQYYHMRIPSPSSLQYCFLRAWCTTCIRYCSLRVPFYIIMLFNNPNSHRTVKHRQRCWLKRDTKLIPHVPFQNTISNLCLEMLCIVSEWQLSNTVVKRKQQRRGNIM